MTDPLPGWEVRDAEGRVTDPLPGWEVRDAEGRVAPKRELYVERGPTLVVARDHSQACTNRALIETDHFEAPQGGGPLGCRCWCHL